MNIPSRATPYTAMNARHSAVLLLGLRCVTVEVVPGAEGSLPLLARIVHTADGAVLVLNRDRHSDALHIAYGHPAPATCGVVRSGWGFRPRWPPGGAGRRHPRRAANRRHAVRRRLAAIER